MFSRFARGLIMTLAVASLAMPAVSAQSYRQQGIYPVFDGWETLPDGSMEFYFGYMNRHTTQITIPLGPDNTFDAPADQNQPTHFLPGRHEHVFTIKKPKGFNGKLIWTLKSGVGVQKATGSTDQLYILEVEEEDGGGHAEPPQITAGPDGAGKVGQPIALTTAIKATAQKERVIEGSVGARNAGAGLAVHWSLHRGPGTVSFAAVPGAPAAPRPAGGRGGRPEAPPTPGIFTTNCSFPIAATCGAVNATFSAPGDYVLRAVAQQQRETVRTFVRVRVSQ